MIASDSADAFRRQDRIDDLGHWQIVPVRATPDADGVIKTPDIPRKPRNQYLTHGIVRFPHQRTGEVPNDAEDSHLFEHSNRTHPLVRVEAFGDFPSRGWSSFVQFDRNPV